MRELGRRLRVLGVAAGVSGFGGRLLKENLLLELLLLGGLGGNVKGGLAVAVKLQRRLLGDEDLAGTRLQGLLLLLLLRVGRGRVRGLI